MEDNVKSLSQISEKAFKDMSDESNSLTSSSSSGFTSSSSGPSDSLSDPSQDHSRELHEGTPSSPFRAKESDSFQDYPSTNYKRGINPCKLTDLEYYQGPPCTLEHHQCLCRGISNICRSDIENTKSGVPQGSLDIPRLIQGLRDVDTTRISDLPGGMVSESSLSKKSLSGCQGTFTINPLFEWIGRTVAAKPKLVFSLCLLVTLIFGAGVYKLRVEVRPYKLWVSKNSDFLKVLEWQGAHFPHFQRHQIVIWEGENVLTAKSIQKMWLLHNNVKQMVEPVTGTSWEKICVRMPSLVFEEAEVEEDTVESGVPEDDFGIKEKRQNENIEQETTNLTLVSNDAHNEKHTDSERSVDEELGMKSSNLTSKLFVRKRSIDIPYSDVSLYLSREKYCGIIDKLNKVCYETGLLEIWGFNKDNIMNLRDSEVIDAVNSASVSKVFGYNTNFTKYLGGVEYNETGHIMKAKAAVQVWISQLDHKAVEGGSYIIDPGTGQHVDKNGMLWEQEWTKAVLEINNGTDGVHAYAQSASSYGAESKAGLWDDFKFLVIGIFVMLIFVYISIGRRNYVEQRPILTLFGLFGVAQSGIIAFGLCSALGIVYGPLNSAIPALLLGHGVDDMFVIMAAWDSFANHKTASTDLVERAGLTLRKAGLAITVTSLTDIVAFVVGSFSEVPALLSFCLYAAAGILAGYFMQITFFLASLVCDEARLMQRRNGLLWCIKHENWSPSKCSKRDLLAEFFSKFMANFLLLSPVRIILLIISVTILLLSIYGAAQIHREFDPMLLVPSSSYLHKWIEASYKYFPTSGEPGYLYFTNISLPNQLPSVYGLTQKLSTAAPVSDISTWYEEFIAYYESSYTYGYLDMTEDVFRDALSLFLHSASGAGFQKDFVFSGSIDCYRPVPNIKSFRVGFVHLPAPSPAQQQYAMRTINEILNKSDVEGLKLAYANVYTAWEANEVVGRELPRNLCLAGFVVGIVAFLLLWSLWTAVLVMLCVVSTVVGTAAIMWLWGLTIDTISCITLILSISFSVDYAVHIAHAYLTANEYDTRVGRAKFAVSSVGPAVFHGGVSTLLAFLLLAGSSSHVFVTFFKVFTTSAILGLYYGIVLLPVMLSVIGPLRIFYKKELNITSENFDVLFWSKDHGVSEGGSLKKLAGVKIRTIFGREENSINISKPDE